MTTYRAQLGDRSLFPALQPKVYLNHAAISPPSVAVVEAMGTQTQAYTERGVAAFTSGMEVREGLRGRLATMIGAERHELAFMPNTSAGVIAIANSFPWRFGDVVVVFEGEFPTNVTPWQRAAAREHLQLKMLPLPSPTDPLALLELLEPVLEQGVRMVAISAVQFQTGSAMPLVELGALCRRYGAALFVDAIQAIGVVPIDVEAMNIDFLACGGHKWLMGLEGTGFVYTDRRWDNDLRPNLAGWRSHENGLGFLFEGAGHLRYDRPIKTGASMLEAGASNAVGLAGTAASVELIAQLGVESIFDHVQTYHDILEPSLLARGFVSARSPNPVGRSGILAFRPPPELDVISLVAGLRLAGVSTSPPDGWFRLAPHWPNGLAEVDIIVDAIDRQFRDS